MGTQSPAVRTLTQIDYVRLTRLASLSDRDASEAVQALLEESDLVASAAVPATVVTMYTQVLLQGDTDTAPYKVTLCYPDDAEPSQGFISVLSPLGASLLGLRVGDVARWRTPLGGERTARIVEVLFQPEASGNYTI
ncbi:MAG TPA: GreA/GreB family elongation factor [Ramlibacter sp.]|nr:GreA/GreB family elongation factor [Ramlibacter sp.]